MLRGVRQLVAPGEANRHDNLGASLNLYILNLYSVYRFLDSCKTGGGVTLRQRD